MLQAFLFDFKKRISATNSFRQLGQDKKIQLIVFGAIALLLIVSLTITCIPAILIFTALLVIVINTKVVAHIVVLVGKCNKKTCRIEEENADQVIDGTDSTSCQQIRWFARQRIEVAKCLLDDICTDVSKESCLDLLIDECTEKLKEVRKSEIVKNRLKPLLAPIGIIFVSLSTAYLYSTNIISNKIDSGTFSNEWFSEIMKALAADIISNDSTLLLFIVLCVYILIFYLICAFVLLPILVQIIDRDRYLIEELRSALLYIKHENIQCVDAESSNDIMPVTK